MEDLLTRLRQLSSAEDFFHFFGLPFDERVLQVNRLHILKRFYQYLHRADDLTGLGDVDLFRRYRELLGQAYQDFVASSALREKIFKVFQDTDATQHVQLSSLRDSLAERRRAA